MVKRFRESHAPRIHGLRLLPVCPGSTRWVPGDCVAEGVERILEHLGALKEVLEEPSPRRGEIEEYDPPGAELRSLFVEMLDEVGEVPEDETSREVLLGMASGPKYEAYREMSDRILEHLDFVADHLKEMKGRYESLKICGVRG